MPTLRLSSQPSKEALKKLNCGSKATTHYTQGKGKGTKMVSTICLWQVENQNSHLHCSLEIFKFSATFQAQVI